MKARAFTLCKRVYNSECLFACISDEYLVWTPSLLYNFFLLYKTISLGTVDVKSGGNELT